MVKLTSWQFLATGLLVFLFQSVLLQNQVENECQKICGNDSTCKNDSGNYRCSCKIGFWRVTNQEKTFLNISENDCVDCGNYLKKNNECKNGYNPCDGNTDRCCANPTCGVEQCGKHSKCKPDCDQVLCECKPGFQLPNGGRTFKSINENKCEDIDECKRNASICGPKGSCINTEGDYHCKCKQGYAKSFKDDRKLCRDIDECSGSHCDAPAICKNTVGSYTCYCPPGYFQYSSAVQENKTKIKCQEANYPMPSWNISSDEQSVLLYNVTTQLRNLFSSPPNVSSQMDSKKHLEQTLDNLDNLLKLMEDENKEQSHQLATKIMQVMEAWLRMFAFALPNGTTTIKSKAGTELVMEIRTADNSSQDLAQPWLNETQMEVSWKEASKKGEGPSVVGLLSYQNLGFILTGADVEGSDWEQIGKSKELMHEPGKPNYEVLSKVASAFVGHNETTALSSPVTFSFNHPKPESKPDMKVICAFWKPSGRSGHWSQEGCVRLNTSTANRTYCRCNHMTSFAVLMAFYDVEDWTLSVITKVGLIISLICLFFSILTFLFCRAIQGIRTTIHLHLCLSLFAAHVIFLSAGISTNTMACVVIAGLLHYSFLCVFCWMLLEGVQLYLMVVQVFNTHSLKHWHIFLVGYGFPAVLVGISAAINSKGYSSRNCWLSRERGFLWSFLGPVSFIIMVNAVVFLITVWRLSEKFADINPDLTKLKKQRVLTITAIAQLCILGITWIFGLFQFNNQTLFLSYLFTIFNSLQGLFIFLLHCVLKKQVREDYHRWLCQSRRDKTRSSDKYSDFSSTSGSNTLRSPKTLKESGM
ncbi:PREDICTED: CD97 antigen [Thamnophis sirtalis]|uniref:CD97 antigen n=1 Tax=Thamnophis sirtalis TaxID=35019 RepID=A0A6I9YLA9_9SAUR|nr:PREDICTED: CD97 antigen [Thamnophis sirtalis]